MATSNTLPLDSNFQEQLIEAIALKFSAPTDFVRTIYNKGLALVQQTVAKETKDRSKDNTFTSFTKEVLTKITKPEPKKINQPVKASSALDKDTISKSFLDDILKRVGIVKTKSLPDEQNVSINKNFSKYFIDTLKEISFLLNNIQSNTKTQTDTSSSITGEINDDTSQQPQTKEKDFLTEEQKPKTVLIGGYTRQGYEDLKDRLPDIITEGIDDAKLKLEVPKDNKKSGDKQEWGGLLGLLPKGLLTALAPLLGGAGLILGGLAALVGAFMTQGPAKGTLELIGKVGLKGGLIVLAKKIFGTSLKLILKRIPIIGTLLSYGFAIQRFTNGDTIGGIIDLVSGTVQLLDLVAPGLGTVLSLGVDILQAILDAKAGGSSAEASAKKGNILLDWAKGLGSLLYKAVKYIPVLGPLIQATEDMFAGKWLDATYNMLRAIPGVGIVIDVLDWFTGGKTQETIKKGIVDFGKWTIETSKWLYEKAKDLPVIGRLIKIGDAISKGSWAEALTQFSRLLPGMGWLYDFLGFTEEKQTQAFQNAGNIISNFWKWIKDSLWEKVTGFIGGLIDGVKDWWNNLSWDPRSWIGMGPDKVAPSAQTSQPPKAMADGGIVTEPTKALIGEAGPEAVIPLDKYFDPKQASLNNDTLKQIADNTSITNESFNRLSNAIFKLAQVFDGKSAPSKNIIVNNQQQQQTYPSASQVAASNVDPIRQVRMQFAI
jgi:hypothetical protein